MYSHVLIKTIDRNRRWAVMDDSAFLVVSGLTSDLWPLMFWPHSDKSCRTISTTRPNQFRKCIGLCLLNISVTFIEISSSILELPRSQDCFTDFDLWTNGLFSVIIFIHTCWWCFYPFTRCKCERTEGRTHTDA